MKICEACNIRISTKTGRCPLCHRELPGTFGDQQVSYPEFVSVKKKDKRLVQIFSFTAIALIISAIVLNTAAWNKSLWSVIFSAYVLYIWLSGIVTFKKNVHLGLKLMTHAIAIPLLLVVVNMFSAGSAKLSQAAWVVSYAMPAVFVCFMLVLSIVVMKVQQNRHEFLIYQFILCLVGFIPLILVIFGVAQPIVPGIIAAVCSLITIFSYITLANKLVKTEFGKKFHV